jgi:hypothetical protein
MNNVSSSHLRKKIRDRNREYVRKIKESTPCADCQIQYHYSQMDFDHIESKKINISRLANSEASIKTIKKEIEKCEIVCSNCHRLRTWQREREGWESS